jgi:hypothetical protein
MCLRNINLKKTALAKKEESLTLYKALYIDDHGIFSYYFDHKWTIDVINQSSRVDSYLKNDEIESGEVLDGFHFFENIDDAYKIAYINGGFARGHRVGIFTVLGSDVVAVGLFCGSVSFVSTRATLVKLLHG